MVQEKQNNPSEFKKIHNRVDVLLVGWFASNGSAPGVRQHLFHFDSAPLQI
jgi:hypothetical protein